MEMRDGGDAQREARTRVAGRFWAKVRHGSPDECWLWTGGKSHGYGIVHRPGGKNPDRAHRVSWEIHNGPIPKELQINHHCDNKACVNPRHLYLGTHSQNMDDAVVRGRMKTPLKRSRAATRAASVAQSWKDPQVRQARVQGMRAARRDPRRRLLRPVESAIRRVQEAQAAAQDGARPKYERALVDLESARLTLLEASA